MKTAKELFPNLVDEGKKYGLSNYQISQLQRYLNDKKMLRVINLGSFNHNAKAWLAALTGIMAEIFAMDAHFSIWMDKKLEKPRNWILDKINSVIPTKIDDIAVKALQTAQRFTDNTILPTKEKIASNISGKMHDKYEYHANAKYLGNSLSDLKKIAKANLSESKTQAKNDAIKTLKQRKFDTELLGAYRDDSGNWVDMRKYKNPTETVLFRALNKGKKGKENIEKQQKQESQEIP